MTHTNLSQNTKIISSAIKLLHNKKDKYILKGEMSRLHIHLPGFQLCAVEDYTVTQISCHTTEKRIGFHSKCFSVILMSLLVACKTLVNTYPCSFWSNFSFLLFSVGRLNHMYAFFKVSQISEYVELQMSEESSR